MKAEEQGRDAVGQAHDEHTHGPAGLEREPHERDVLEGVAELARRDRRVGEAEVVPAEEMQRAGGRALLEVRERLLALSRQGIGQNCLHAVHQSSARETIPRPFTISTP